jgi:hypothetical protein
LQVRTQLLGLRPREQKHGISHLGVR